MTQTTVIDHQGAAAPRPGFRPDLEGLRAVAVVLVLLFHAGVPGFDGGYVGVDVFYVLSGFLITGLLLREADRTGRIGLAAFYARRARRLLPAALLVLLVTLAVSVVVLPPLRIPDVAGDATASALYVGNVRFAWQATDYLQSAKAASPLLHYWSLGVEEQFYLVWPALILLVLWRRPLAPRRVAILAATAMLASFGLSVWLTGVKEPWAFFLLPSRAWELGLGALLALGSSRLRALPAGVGAALAWCGLLLVATSALVLSTQTPFPGTAALLPTVGCALVIAGGFRQEPGIGGPGRWLSLPVPRFLGRISYSLYLWHWPVLLLPAAMIGTELSWWSVGALLLLSVGLATVTQRWVEEPFRHGRWIGTASQRTIALALAASVGAASVAAFIGLRTSAVLSSSPSTDLASDERQLGALIDAPPERTPSMALPVGLRPSLAESQHTQALPGEDGCHLNFGGVESGPCEYGSPSGSQAVVLFGDSHALAWFPAVDRLARERGWRLVSLTKSACSPADAAQWASPFKRPYGECAEWRDNAVRRIAEEDPALVLLTSSDGFIAVGDNGQPLVDGPERAMRWRAGMARTIAALQAVADQVTVIADVPSSQFDVPVCLSEHRDDTGACATPLETALDLDWFDQQEAVAEESAAGFVDATRWVCPSEPCPAVIGSFMVLRDSHHLAPPFAQALAGHLEKALAGGTGAVPTSAE
jgi:peptidoglycan/LPS O-acetylase OafA/YrhL